MGKQIHNDYLSILLPFETWLTWSLLKVAISHHEIKCLAKFLQHLQPPNLAIQNPLPVLMCNAYAKKFLTFYNIQDRQPIPSLEIYYANTPLPVEGKKNTTSLQSFSHKCSRHLYFFFVTRPNLKHKCGSLSYCGILSHNSHKPDASY